MEKEIYEKPIVEVVILSTNDIVCSSTGWEEGDTDIDLFDMSGWR